MSSLPSAYADSNDPASPRLKRIQEELRKSLEEQFQVDELDKQDANATSQSVLKWKDEFSFVSAQPVGNYYELPEEPDITYIRFLYRFDHRGKRLYDQSHFDQNGFIYGNPKFMHGVDWGLFGDEVAWDMDGLDDFAVVPSSIHNQITGLTQFSFTALVHPKDLTLLNARERCIFAQQEDPSNTWCKKLEVGTTGKVYFSLRIAGQDRLFEGPTGGIALNLWQFIVVTFNEYATPKCTMYVNGVAKTVVTSAHNPGFTSTEDDSFIIGVDKTPINLLGGTAQVYDTFPTAYDLTTDEQVSTDLKWKLYYHGSNPTDSADLGKGGVRVPAAPTGSFARVLYAYPYVNANNTATSTSASLIVNNPNYYTDFDVTFSIRTVSQKRTPTPRAWETVWFMFRFNEAQNNHFHHYYLAFKSNGKLEFGRKDNADSVEHQYYLLDIEPPFNWVLNQWNLVRVRAEGNRFEVWVDNVLLIDLVDDGTKGTPNTDTTFGVPPHPPSDFMYSGLFGLYNEDAEVEMSPMTITSLAPVGVQAQAGFWEGGMQDLRMYRRVLTAAEALQMFNNKISVSNISYARVATVGGSVFNE